MDSRMYDKRGRLIGDVELAKPTHTVRPAYHFMPAEEDKEDGWPTFIAIAYLLTFPLWFVFLGVSMLFKVIIPGFVQVIKEMREEGWLP